MERHYIKLWIKYHKRYILTRMRALYFVGSALEDLRAFPRAIRREAGYQLERLQFGLEPGDWKPMTTVGAGVREIRIQHERPVFG